MERLVIKLKDILKEITEDDFLNKPSDEIVSQLGRPAFSSDAEAIKYIDTLKTTPFPNGFSDMPSEITLYRVLVLRGDKKVNENELGIHFISDPDTIDRDWLENVGVLYEMGYEMGYDFDEESDELYDKDTELWLLTCKVSKTNIDYKATLEHRMDFPTEKEFTLKSPTGVRVINKEELDLEDYL